MKRKQPLMPLLFTLFVTFQLSGQKSIEYQLKIEPKPVEARDGNTYQGELGWIKVPEIWGDETSPQIDLPFFRLKTQHPKPLPPIFIFDGGPGDTPSTIQNLRFMAPILSQFTKVSDLIVVEQRGNGISNPNLTCPGSLDLPLDVPLDPDLINTRFRSYLSECQAYWESNGRALSGYNVEAMAADIEAVRTALNYDKIMIFGGSFGSHHGLTYLKKYPDQVDRVLLTLPEGLNHTVKLPSAIDKVLAQLSFLVEQDSVLSEEGNTFLNQVKSTLNQLEQSPVSEQVIHPVTKKEVAITLGKYDLQMATALNLGRITYRSLPFYFKQMQQGNFSWLARESISYRININHNLMAVLTDCNSGASQERWHRVMEEEKTAILGNVLNDLNNFDICQFLPLRDFSTHRAGFTSSVPMLIIAGSQDARTPLRNAQELLFDFENAHLLIMKHGSHDLFQEAFGLLSELMLNYLSVENPLSLDLPMEMTVPLNLKKK